jgi:hypothetical protein
MLLTYIDESGVNYKKTNGFYSDGPYVIWCAILIHENKYFHLERLFSELLKSLKIKDWSKIEAHATDIWSRKGNFGHISKDASKMYFEELFQLLAKLDIEIVFGIQQKFARSNWRKNQEVEKNNCRYALLHGLEHSLAKLNETSIIISDEGDKEIDNLLFEKTQWRFNPGARKPRGQRSKYKFESLSCFLLDRVHFMNSQHSLFLQIADQVAFVIQRVFTYCYLIHFPNKFLKPEIDKVPISSETFAFVSKNISPAFFDTEANDVMFLDLEQSLSKENYLNSRIFEIIQKSTDKPGNIYKK